MKYDFYKYLAEATKTFKYRIKTVAPVDARFLAILENHLMRYGLCQMADPKKTILQDNPMEFKDVYNVEVYIIDVETEIPVAPYLLQQDLKGLLNIPERYIVVRAENEPIEVETVKMMAMKEIEAEAAKRGLTVAALLSTDPAYVETGLETQDAFGNEYNTRLLKYLASVTQARVEANADGRGKMFSALKDMQDSDFNAAYDTPKPVNYNAADKSATKDGDFNNSMGSYGNFDDTKKKYIRKYSNAAGQPLVVTQETK